MYATVCIAVMRRISSLDMCDSKRISWELGGQEWK
jgi:hypothetical protein